MVELMKLEVVAGSERYLQRSGGKAVHAASACGLVYGGWGMIGRGGWLWKNRRD